MENKKELMGGIRTHELTTIPQEVVRVNAESACNFINKKLKFSGQKTEKLVILKKVKYPKNDKIA